MILELFSNLNDSVISNSLPVLVAPLASFEKRIESCTY